MNCNSHSLRWSADRNVKKGQNIDFSGSNVQYLVYRWIKIQEAIVLHTWACKLMFFNCHSSRQVPWNQIKKRSGQSSLFDDWPSLDRLIWENFYMCRRFLCEAMNYRVSPSSVVLAVGSSQEDIRSRCGGSYSTVWQDFFLYYALNVLSADLRVYPFSLIALRYHYPAALVNTERLETQHKCPVLWDRRLI